MSRIGKKIIALPEKTEVTISGSLVTVKGPKGTLARSFSPDITIKTENGQVTLALARKEIPNQALWGTYASHIINMIEGVNQGFQKKLIIEGIGFRAEVKGQDLILNLGFSHPVKMAIPTELKVTSEKGIMTIVGIDKELVGQFAAQIRALKEPEPYKGKGIRYDNEVVRRKQGKKAA
jgi:large subunit ribosomal protein L6